MEDAGEGHRSCNRGATDQIGASAPHTFHRQVIRENLMVGEDGPRVFRRGRG